MISKRAGREKMIQKGWETKDDTKKGGKIDNDTKKGGKSSMIPKRVRT